MEKSIRIKKRMVPITVTPYKDGYKIVQGTRRYYAAKQAGLKKFPAG